VPDRHISMEHPVWTPLSQPDSPDRDGKKRKRSEYERLIQTPAVPESVDKKDELAHFEQGWVLPEGSRRTRQGPMTPIRTDLTAELPPSGSPGRRATSLKQSQVSVSAADEPQVNPEENIGGQRPEKKMSKAEKLKLRKLKDKERNQRRRDQAKRDKEARLVVVIGDGIGRSGPTGSPLGEPQDVVGHDALAPGTTSGTPGEIGAEEQLGLPPLENLFDGDSSLSDSEDEQRPTVDTQPSAPTDGYGTTIFRASTLSPPPPSPPPRMPTRDRRGKSTPSVPQAQDHKDNRDPILEVEQNKEPSGRNRSRAALGSPPEAGPDGSLEGGTLGED
jgi:hypothetical protein